MISTRKIILSAIVVYIACYVYYIDFENIDPRARTCTLGMIKYHGYEGEEYEVESEDGFLIKLFRLLPKSGNKNATPVMIVPGIHCNSDTIIAMGPGFDYAYNVSDNDFDVWLPNFRGNWYSRPKPGVSHTWEELNRFSFHEQGVYDLSAAIDTILNITGKSAIQVAAGSMAANNMYALLSTKPEYNDKISRMLILGPTGFFTTLTTWTQYIFFGMLRWSGTLTDIYATHTKYRAEMSELICGNKMSLVPCRPFVANYLGYNFTTVPPQLALYVIITGPFLGIYNHMEEMMMRGAFTMRDLGKEKNLEVYKSEIPPLYPMENIKVPTKLFYTENDHFMNEKGRQAMIDFIPNKFDIYAVPQPFGHGNFISNTAVSPALIEEIVKTLKMDLISA